MSFIAMLLASVLTLVILIPIGFVIFYVIDRIVDYFF